MMKRGLLEEVTAFYDARNKRKREETDPAANPAPAHRNTLWEAIGFAEFLPWLRSARTDPRLANRCAADVVVHTRRYARKQQQWIHNKIIPGGAGLWEAYTLNAALGSVAETAVGLAKAFALGEAPPPELKAQADAAAAAFGLVVHRPPGGQAPGEPAEGDDDGDGGARESSIAAAPSGSLAGAVIDGVKAAGNRNGLLGTDTSLWVKRTCDECQRTLNGDNEWTVHLRSKGHRSCVRRNKAAAEERLVAERLQAIEKERGLVTETDPKS